MDWLDSKPADLLNYIIDWSAGGDGYSLHLHTFTILPSVHWSNIRRIKRTNHA